MYDFEYHRPGSVAEASNMVKAAADGRFLAGGMTLLPTMKQRLASPSDLVDLSDIEALKGIRVVGKALAVGAMTRHAEVADSVEVKDRLPALAELASRIGDAHVRNRGTLGGSIANNDPAADYPAACVGLDATIHTSERDVTSDDFFAGLFETILNEREIVTSVSFPIPEAAAYAKFPNPASRYAIVGVFVAKTGSNVRVAVTGAGADGVFRVAAMEEALASNFSSNAIAGIEVDPAALNSDIHASAEYRAHLIGIMAKRAVIACGT